MFEKCGIRDILYHIYKSRAFVIAVTVSFLVLGIVVFAVNTLMSKPAEKSERGIWVASACYLVTLDPSVDVGRSTIDQIKSEEESMAATYAAILSSDFSREQIYDHLLTKYTKKDLIDNLELQVEEDELTAFSLSTALKVSVLERTSIVNFFVKAKDKAFAQDYLEECHTIFKSTTALVEGSHIQYVDGVIDNNLSEGSAASNMGRMAIPLMAILGFVLSVLVVSAKALFVPTINRKSDFCAYGLPVIGEASLPSRKDGHKA